MKEFGKYFIENLKIVINDLKSKDKEKMKRQIPNFLTLTRGILAPLTIIPAVIKKKIFLAFVLIALCALTDTFDGWYARKHNFQSEFGALLDAICDKIFIITLAFPLVFIYTSWILVILILEIVIAIINTYSKLKGNKPASSLIGKSKTVVLDIFIALCYLNFLVRVPRIILMIAATLTNIMQLFSIGGYYRTYRNQTLDQSY